LASVATAHSASAASVCGARRISGTKCSVEVDLDAFMTEAAVEQHQSAWCWAACVSMILNYHGCKVSQEQVVMQEYGGLPNRAAQVSWRISKQLSRKWVGDGGDRYEARLVSLFDLESGIFGLTNFDVIDALEDGEPLLVGTQGHAVVQIGFDYTKDYLGNIHPNRVDVFDPWPGRGRRNLTSAETTPSQNPWQPFTNLHYVARPSVTKI